MEVSGRREWDNNTSTNKQHGQQIIVCQPCKSESDTVEADAFCETCNEFICTPCLKVHRKMKMSKNHVIKMKDEMPKYENRQQDLCSEFCAVHKTEIVKFYCEDHDSVGCGDCVILNHKTCSVKLVSEVSNNYDTSQKLERIKQKIIIIDRELSSHRDEIINGLKTADEMSERIIKEIKLFRKDINEYLDSAEKDLLQELDKLKTRQVSRLKHIQGEFDTMVNEIKECEKKIYQTSDKINDLFVAAKISQEKTNAYQISTEKLAATCEFEIWNFLKSKEFVTILTKKSPIGVLNSQRREIQTKNKKKSLIDPQTKLLKRLNVRGSKERNSCFISGMAVLSCDELLLVDFSNCSVKILNLKENRITSKYTTAGSPCDITSINSTTFAVTIQSNGEILFIKTCSGISKSHIIMVKKHCRGIDYRDGVLAVSFVNPASVQLLNTKGVIMHELDIKKHCLCPDYIALSNDNKSFIVSDNITSVLCEFSADGNYIAKISSDHVKTPGGLAMTEDGTVIVCCNGIADKLKICKPKTGEISSIDVKGVKEPYNFALSDDQSRIFVFDSSESHIKVFHILSKVEQK